MLFVISVAKNKLLFVVVLNATIVNFATQNKFEQLFSKGVRYRANLWSQMISGHTWVVSSIVHAGQLMMAYAFGQCKDQVLSKG